MRHRIALVGDFSPTVVAHRAIPRALEQVRAETSIPVEWQWVHTSDIHDVAVNLADCEGVWLVPASPYANMEGALSAIRFARETKRPFLGTCGGFQHALIEFARNVVGLATADHAETNPTGTTLVVTPLACSLVEKTGDVHFIAGSRLREIYGCESVREGYHCNYGVNATHRAAFERAGLCFTAFDNSGEARAIEFPPAVHPFFIGTLFQPERAALRGETPAVVRAFASAVAKSQRR